MAPVQARYQFATDPVANKGAIVQGKHFRFTILTDGLVRCEWSEDGDFEDRASTFAVNRNLRAPDYELSRADGIEIITDRFKLHYNEKAFSAKGLNIKLRNEPKTIWNFGDEINDLGGTTRTLDQCDGRAEIGHGILSRDGFGIIDDSKSMLFKDDGWVDIRRKGNRCDFYLFCYGTDYRAAIKAYYAVSGSQPLLPRFSLGNWWTRYYPYTQQEYLDLMDHFKSEKVPMSISVIDLYWHLVDSTPDGSSGWGGYNWNKELYPDPKGFLKALHERGLTTTLNNHPSDGIRWWDKKYKEVCKFVGRDAKKQEQIEFDSVSKKYMDAYFDIVLHDLEKTGVDFWWVDWQQGEHSRIPEIDPLWMLNHFHFLDNSRNKGRPLILSRFAGPGSHRYPLGFSGDAFMNWKSLHFQPEFTATASNIGYAWWSHDIGGHTHGHKDDECTARWFQLGAWSCVFRLHCDNNVFNFREPWKFDKECCDAMEEAMRLRHKLIPYLYTMNARSAAHDEPLICPLYWEYPNLEQAYKHPNQYFFGNQLIVAPVTRPRDKQTHLAPVEVWFPPGRFVDVFTGLIYDGNRELTLHRSLLHTPAFASEGAIVPLDGTWPIPNGCPNPTVIELLVVVGKDGHFDLVEDDGTGSRVDDGDFVMIPAAKHGAGPSSENSVHFTTTNIQFDQSKGILTIGAATPATSAIPSERKWLIRLVSHKLKSDNTVTCTAGNKNQQVTVEATENGTLISIGPVTTGKAIEVKIGATPTLDVQDGMKRCWDILYNGNFNYDYKQDVWFLISQDKPLREHIRDLENADMTEELRGALLEPLVADKRYKKNEEAESQALPYRVADSPQN